MKYTRKMSKKLNVIYTAALFAVFIPLLASINFEATVSVAVLAPIFGLLIVGSFVYRAISYCQLKEDGLYIAPSKEIIPYHDIIGLLEQSHTVLEIEYMVGEMRQTKVLSFVSRNNLVSELRMRMRV